jgi:hypothetical protein
MRDAQPEAIAGVDHTLSTDIVDNADEATAGPSPEPPLELEPELEPERETAGTAEPAPDEAAPDEAPEPEEAAPGQAMAEPEPDEPERDQPEHDELEHDELEPAEVLAYDEDDLTESEWEPEPEPAEMSELIEMSEPVQLAEPAEKPVRRRRGRGLLLGALFLLAACAIVGGAIAIVGSLTHGFKKPVIVTYKKSAIFSLRTGECIDPNGQAATVVPCTTAHEAEVFATFALPASAWPGETGVQTAASTGCDSRLTGYLNPQLAISLATTFVYPDKVAWQAGTRTVICEVHATSGNLNGSVRGATAG